MAKLYYIGELKPDRYEPITALADFRTFLSMGIGIMGIGEKLLILRKIRGYTQEHVATQLGVSERTVHRWELGADIKLSLYHKYCSLLDVTPVQLEQADPDTFFKDKDSAKDKDNGEDSDKDKE